MTEIVSKPGGVPLITHYVAVFRRFADFQGRSRRSEYWWFQFANVVATVLIATVSASIGVLGPEGNSPLNALYALVAFVPALAVAVRRLHDIGKSGFWVLLGIIPLIGFIILLIWFCRDSEADNTYGPNPKGIR